MTTNRRQFTGIAGISLVGVPGGELLAQPKHRYIRHTDPDKSFTVATGTNMFLGHRLSGDDILDLEGFDWKRYTKRLGNTLPARFTNTRHRRLTC